MTNLPVTRRNQLLQNILSGSTLTGVKEYLSFVKDELIKIRDSGTDGIEIARFHSDMMDMLLETLVRKAMKGIQDPEPLKFSLIAVGGYGRKELNPASDIDIIFLVDSEESEEVKKVNELILKTAYPLWDSGLDISYTVRSIADCIELSIKNDAVLTSLLDARLICGRQEEFLRFERELRGNLLQNLDSIFERIARMVEQRRIKNQHPGKFLEPNVKETEGGLRDYHTIRWLVFLKLGSHKVEDLLNHRLVTKSNYRRFLEALRFLFVIRNELHFYYKRKHDEIDYESQKRIAEFLHYEDRKNESGVERFMKDFYISTQIIRGFLEDVFEKLFHYNPESVKGVLSEPIQVDFPFVIDGNTISIDRKEAMKNPKNVLKFFHLVAKTGLKGDFKARKVISRSAKMLNRFTLRKHENFLIFWSIFQEPYVFQSLKEMYKCGILFRLFPEFKKIYFKIQYDIYHVYPVDIHSLYVIQELDRLKRGEYSKDEPLLSFLIKEVKDLSLLYFSALFHDIGKGYGKGHSKRGAIVVVKIMNRLRIDEESIQRASFLVRNHLLMSEVAQRRDLSDPKHIFDFSKIVGDRERLKCLYILTYVDLKAVSPYALTHWKSSLLQELYIKAEELLEKGKISESVLNEKILAVQNQLRKELSKLYSRDEIESFLEIFPLKNFVDSRFEDLLKYFEIFKELENKKYYIFKEDYPEKKFSKIIFASVDAPGLFSKITGVLSSNGINILSAQINTMRNGRIIDVFYVNDIVGEAITDPLRWDKAIKDLEDVMEDRISVHELVASRMKPSILKVKKRAILPTRIVIDNHSSDLYTLIEIYTHDKPGLLYLITSTLSRLSLNICSAKISTKVDQVADVFYVTDLDGRKILLRKALKKIRDTLLEAIGK